MKISKIILITTIAIIGAFPSYCMEDKLGEVVKELADMSLKFNIKTLTVGDFIAKNDVSDSEIDYIKEKTIQLLSKKRNLSVFDSSKNEKSDAVVCANVYKKEDGFEVMFKLIKTEDLKVIAILSQNIDKIGVLAYKKSEFNDSDMDFKSLKKLAKEVSFEKEFRDSIKDFEFSDCSKGKIWVENIQRETVDMRARYWAYKMKQPDFSFKSLTSNPGSEIRDTDLKNRFYELLKNYYYSDKKINLESADRKYIEEIFKKEKEITGKCSTLAWSGL
ncbi:MAG: hypothetical protein N2Z60_00580 [Elusimicrobiales bacterium]|nr:hypothetical protein [Elusimicrobiales bacterium]